LKQILVLGAGFAGLWAAASAARALDERGIGPETVRITVVNADRFHSVRVRNYEADLADVRVPLADVLDPIGVETIVAHVSDIRPGERHVRIEEAGASRDIFYDRLVLALGSRLRWPDVPGLRENAFDVDTTDSAARLAAHLSGLAHAPNTPGRDTVLVIGAGLTGIETAAEMPARLRALGREGRVILADHSVIGSNMGEDAMRVIEPALISLGVECRPGVRVASIDAAGATLATGERIEAATIVWCAGMEASPLTRCFGVVRDRFGRLPVAPTLKIIGCDAEFAAGDVAYFAIDGTHDCVMSCQHGRPMGRFAGHNVVCDLLGEEMLPLRINWYTTILDLGPWGAVYTEGWDRKVIAEGTVAKRTKETINRQRIYPPRTRARADILAAAAPELQPPPYSA
jgi:NADH dehydrogenase